MSSSKTANLQLNQWQANDDFLREEFNQDNAKVDAAVGALQVAHTAGGTYTGDGIAGRMINLGFKPQALFIQGTVNGVDCFMMSFSGKTLFINSTTFANAYDHIRFNETGFQIMYTHYINVSKQPYYYFAIR